MRCPKCNQTVSGQDITAGTCSHCGEAFPENFGKAPRPTSASSKRTVSIRRGFIKPGERPDPLGQHRAGGKGESSKEDLLGHAAGRPPAGEQPSSPPPQQPPAQQAPPPQQPPAQQAPPPQQPPAQQAPPPQQPPAQQPPPPAQGSPPDAPQGRKTVADIKSLYSQPPGQPPQSQSPQQPAPPQQQPPQQDVPGSAAGRKTVADLKDLYSQPPGQQAPPSPQPPEQPPAGQPPQGPPADSAQGRKTVADIKSLYSEPPQQQPPQQQPPQQPAQPPQAPPDSAQGRKTVADLKSLYQQSQPLQEPPQQGQPPQGQPPQQQPPQPAQPPAAESPKGRKTVSDLQRLLDHAKGTPGSQTVANAGQAAGEEPITQTFSKNELMDHATGRQTFVPPPSAPPQGQPPADHPAGRGTVPNLGALQVPPTGQETVHGEQRHQFKGKTTFPEGEQAALASGRPLGPDEQTKRTITAAWGNSLHPGVHPGMTIKSESKQTFRAASSIIVKPRSIGDAKSQTEVPPDYEVTDVLGEGGMGVVYVARQTSVDRTIAIKMIKPGLAQDDDLKAKFLTEAAVTGDLDHPNIVPIHDLGSNEAGCVFYAMKRVKGTPWCDVVREKTLSENLDILLRVADAMGFAHSRNVLHRDLKPENVMLGNFGEVLVMDWGLALSVTPDGKAESLESADSMCGTPAYMAPEMATGPISKIGFGSDIYLLGAILFEIITGEPPHYGDTTLNCLFAAGMNEIQPTDRKGELLDIALKAMATEPEDRFVSVRQFQQAIRDFQSHSESITLSDKARQDYEKALAHNNYDDYAQAMFGFKEALALWDGNRTAHQGLSSVRIEYAKAALDKDDLDLAESLLEPDNPAHRDLVAEVHDARAERKARQRRLTVATWAARSLAAAILLVMTVAFFWVTAAKNEADVARQTAEKERDRAKEAEQNAQTQKDIAVAEKKNAEMEAARALREQIRAEKQAGIARLQRQISDIQEQIARDARQEADYEAYVAKIGLAAANIADNGFGQATVQLQETDPNRRWWEWGRLKYLTELHKQSYDSVQGNVGNDVERPRLEDAAVSGDLLIAASRDGKARIWNRDTGQLVREIEHSDQPIYAVAVSHAGGKPRLATGGLDRMIKVWDLQSGELQATLEGHGERIFSLTFSPDGKNLLSGAADYTARLWDIDAQEEIRRYQGHIDWVWSVRFSPDGKRFVSASQDGSAIVWSVQPEEGSESEMDIGSRKLMLLTYDDHGRPVYAADFTPDGKFVVTGSYDKTAHVWNAETGERKFIFEGHGGRVNSVAFSPDGKYLITGARDNTAKVWSTETGEELETLRGHAASVSAAEFVADEPGNVVTASQDGYCKLWNIDDYSEYRVLRGHTNEVLSAIFSPDGTQVLTGSRDRSARVWDAATGQLMRTFQEGHNDKVLNVDYTPDGKRALSCSEDGTVRIWDLDQGIQLAVLEGHVGPVQTARFCNDGKWIISGGDDETVRLWDAGKATLIRKFEGHHAPINSVAVNSDLTRVLSCCSNAKARMWNLQTGELLLTFSRHSKPIHSCAFFPNSTLAATASSDRVIGIWDTATGNELRTLPHRKAVTSLAISPDGKRLASGTSDGAIRIWDPNSGQVVRTLDGHAQVVTTLRYWMSPDKSQTRLLSASPDKTARLWNPETGETVLTLPAHDYFCWSVAFRPDGKQIITGGDFDVKVWDNTGKLLMTMAQHGAVSSADFSPDGKDIITGSWDRIMKRWSAETGYSEQTFQIEHREQINSVAYSPDGKTAVSAGNDRKVLIWDAQKGTLLKSLDGGNDAHRGRVQSATFSPNGQFVLTASNDFTAKIWSVQDGRVMQTLVGHNGPVLQARYSPDGKRILTASEDGTAKLWSAASGTLLRSFEGHTATLTSVAFSPVGPRMITGSEDLTAKIWDLETGKEILTLKGHALELTSVAFSPDGKLALTASRDGTARIWPAVRARPPEGAIVAEAVTAAD